ncbi:hypothetical protein [Kutzneria kofuensis]|uniref:hypothetical protein n=1 Tax=Kutzneria kofuensis TaxID=103725 RepID=UPI0031F02629
MPRVRPPRRWTCCGPNPRAGPWSPAPPGTASPAWRTTTALLDPIKVSVTCPGTDRGRKPRRPGIPAKILTAYLETRRIVVEKTDAYTCLILFSMASPRASGARSSTACSTSSPCTTPAPPSPTSCPVWSRSTPSATRS